MERIAAELKPIAYLLNRPLLENAKCLIDKVDTGQVLSDWEVGHLIDLHQRARVLTP